MTDVQMTDAWFLPPPGTCTEIIEFAACVLMHGRALLDQLRAIRALTGPALLRRNVAMDRMLAVRAMRVACREKAEALVGNANLEHFNSYAVPGGESVTAILNSARTEEEEREVVGEFCISLVRAYGRDLYLVYGKTLPADML